MEKRLKEEFKRKAQENPRQYYPVETLLQEGFERKQCRNCGNFFWSVEEREVCGEPDCSGGYTFIGSSPAREKMDFIQTWDKFSSFFSGLGYTPMERYPVAARWREDTDFVQASIYDFQPFVVTGEVEPPANPLVIPQFCLRFNDIDNVGITGRHYTGFVMIGQHAFEPGEGYRPNDYLDHIYRWLTRGMKIPREELQFHEDAWSGGGNLGPSMEFFSRGLEIGNQVYMQYGVEGEKLQELDIKVLDMGMGQERPAWFTHGTSTSYEVVFGSAMEKLYSRAALRPEHRIFREFLPYSGLLNVEEIASVEDTWQGIANKLGLELEELKKRVLPLAALYSIADHSRSLLLALADGVLPSNSGGGYNLRALFRRSQDFIHNYGWDIDLAEVCRWHSEYLKPQYPELKDHLEEVEEILEVEKRKYNHTREKARRVIRKLKKEEVGAEKLIELYDSQGISPEMLKSEGLEVEVPEDFYVRLAERHEEAEEEEEKKFRAFSLEGLPPTKILYYDDYRLLEFKAKVLKVIEGKYVVLDKTAFYPTSGGQDKDRGYLDSSRVTDVFRQGSVVLHRVEDPGFREGEMVGGRIEEERRIQLAQHHTATHIVNGAAREVLGRHVWQAGAEKTVDKARLDITHYQSLSREELRAIEERANQMVADSLPVESQLLPRNVAEERYGFTLYQGGAVPGKEIRVIKIDEVDIEACGGTHLNNTSEARLIKITGTTKIQDGIIRLEFCAGEAAFRYISKMEEELEKTTLVLDVNMEQLSETARRFFEEWKAQRKEIQALKRKIALLQRRGLENSFQKAGKAEYLVASLEADQEECRRTAQSLAEEGKAVLLLGVNDTVSVVGARGKGVEVDMAEVVREVAAELGGGGGGRPDFAQGAGKKGEKLEEALSLGKKMLLERL